MTVPNATSDLSNVGTLEQWLRDLIKTEAHDAVVKIDDRWSADDYLDLHLRRGARTGVTLRITGDDAVLAGSDPTDLTARLRQLVLVL